MKGPRLTERDVAVLRFVAEQRAVRGDVVRRLLAAHAGAVDLTARTLLRHVGRWEQLGLVRREHFQLGRREPIPGAWTWLYLTRRGDARVGLGRLEPVTLDLGERKHLHAVTVTRLAMEADGWGWEPERLLGPRYAELRRTTMARIRRPDGLAGRDGQMVAVEVELTLKRPAHRYSDILRDTDPDAAAVWWFTRPELVERLERSLRATGPLAAHALVFPLPEGATDVA